MEPSPCRPGHAGAVWARGRVVARVSPRRGVRDGGHALAEDSALLLERATVGSGWLRLAAGPDEMQRAGC